MKHSLENVLQKLQIKASPKEIKTLLLYLEELLLWNKKINLISRNLKKEEVLSELLFPSLIPCKIIDTEEKILDFGAGAGIAGIPLKIFSPKITLHLLEPKFKRAVFLEHVVNLLELKTKVIKKFVRSKEDLEYTYDSILVRAIKPDKIPIELGHRILYYGKYTGEKFRKKDEIQENNAVISVLF